MIGEHGGPVLELDRHYLRRRDLNRHVRKTRRARRLGRFALLLAVNAAVAAVLIAVGAGIVRHYASSPDLAVRRIVVEGTSATSPAAVERALAPWKGRNLAGLDLDRVAADATRDPWVRRASVKRVLPDTLKVAVEERVPAALAVLGGLVHVVDAGGFVMGPAGPGLAFDLPVLSGFDGLSGAHLERALAGAVGHLAALRASDPGFASSLSSIDVSSPDRVAVSTVAPGPVLYLDPEKPDRNLADWLRLRADLERRAGELVYADLRWEGRVVLGPKETLVATRSE
ncbi:MAG TPA: FtsQ-type POTRA domain-containing protein [Candidatus Polarisedimenticolaceae bacterium]